MMIKRGDIIAFKGKGVVFQFLSFLLSIFDRDWQWRQWKPWHLAIAWEQGYDGWYILEALGNVNINLYNNKYLAKNTRNYQWLDKIPTQKAMNQFLAGHIDKSYDVAIYFFTSLAIIIRHYFNRPIPKLLNCRFSCWELVQEFTTDMGKPLVSRYDVVIITDVLKALEAKNGNA